MKPEDFDEDFNFKRKRTSDILFILKIIGIMLIVFIIFSFSLSIKKLGGSDSEIEEKGEGLLIYSRQEGRGIGILNKLKAYKLQDEGYDTVEANHQLGFEDDLRDYAIAAQIIKDLGVKSVSLKTNNPLKIKGLEQYGVTVASREEIEIEVNAYDKKYLKTKKEKMGHILRQEL